MWQNAMENFTLNKDMVYCYSENNMFSVEAFYLPKAYVTTEETSAHWKQK